MTFDSLLESLFYLSIPWILLEVVSRYLHPDRSRLKLRSKRSRLITTADKVTIGSTCISRGPLWIKLETPCLNEWPSYLLRALSYKARARRRSNHDLALHLNGNGSGTTTYKSSRLRWLEVVYQGGTFFAGLSLFGSIVFLMWGAFDVIGKIVSVGNSPASKLADSTPLVKRSDNAISTIADQGDTSWSPNLIPLIPGFTIPFNHIYPLVIALSLTQVIHEAGHAICAALYSWTPLHMGLVLIFPCIPGAFVTLPQEALEDDVDSFRNNQIESSSRQKFQIVSAGVWHNAITALLMALILYGGIGSMSHSLFWRNASNLVVESVEGSSPLAEHMLPGTLVTHINDQDLNASTHVEREAIWRSFLTQQQVARHEQGWCISKELFQKGDTSCCELLKNTTGQVDSNTKGLCFVPSVPHADEIGRCVDPTRLLSAKAMSLRCNDVCSNSNHICIMPDPREQLIRITIRRYLNGQSRVVLFQGDSKAIYAAVHLSPYIFRVESIIPPYTLFKWWSLFLSYFLNLSMAMALLNMLPLPSLDGDVYLGFVLSTFVSRFDYNTSMERLDEEAAVEMELGETFHRRLSSRASNGVGSGNHARGQVKAHLHAKIQQRFRWFTIGLAVFVFGGSIILHATSKEIAM